MLTKNSLRPMIRRMFIFIFPLVLLSCSTDEPTVIDVELNPEWDGEIVQDTEGNTSGSQGGNVNDWEEGGGAEW